MASTVATVAHVTRPCMMCGETSVLILDAAARDRWIAGELVQRAFPEFSSDRRELLISGTHPACWDAMMRGE